MLYKLRVQIRLEGHEKVLKRIPSFQASCLGVYGVGPYPPHNRLSLMAELKNPSSETYTLLTWGTR